MEDMKIREVSTITFPAEIIVSPFCYFQFIHAAGAGIGRHLFKLANTDVVLPYEFLKHIDEEAYSNMLDGLKVSIGLAEGDVCLPSHL